MADRDRECKISQKRLDNIKKSKEALAVQPKLTREQILELVEASYLTHRD